MAGLTPVNTVKQVTAESPESPSVPSDYSVTIHLLPHTDSTRTSPPAQFDPERRDLHEGTILKIGRQVRVTEAPEAAAIAAVLTSGPTPLEIQPASDNNGPTPMIIEPPVLFQSNERPETRVITDEDLTGSPLTPSLETRNRAATSTTENPVSNAAVESLLAQPGGQQPLVPTKSIEHVWFKSKVVSRGHAEMWLRDGQVYLKDTGSSSGTFLNKMRLSPSGKLSRPYPLKDGDVIQLGIDYQGRQEDIYKCIMMKVVITTSSVAVYQRKKENPARFRVALRLLLNATNPYSSNSPTQPSSTTSPAPQPTTTVDCCICLCAIGPFQALFLSPCSHCYHYKCIRNILETHHMFQCPMCRQVANLDASVSMESLVCEDNEDASGGHDEFGGVVTSFGKGFSIEGHGIAWGGGTLGGDGKLENSSGSNPQKKEKKPLSEQEKVEMSMENLERITRNNDQLGAQNITSQE